MRPPVLLAAAVAALLASACAEAGDDPGEVPTPSAGASAAATPTASATPTPTGDPRAVAADELGRVPVLMYHQMISKPGRDDVTPAQFRAELQRLYDEGYRPIRAADLVAGRIDIPAGSSPVVLTFDDSTVSQARIGADGEPRPDTMLGVLEEFGRTHPDFRPTGTFYVNTVPPPFVDALVLPWLAAHGYEIGAHTRSHAFLRELNDSGVQKEIGLNIAEIEALVPGYEVTTFAPTGGLWPRNPSLARRGVHDGRPYEIEGVFGVDVIASASPYAIGFNPFQVPRVGTDDIKVVLDGLKRRPETRYTSDGDPTSISFPSARAGELAPAWRDRARPY